MFVLSLFVNRLYKPYPSALLIVGPTANYGKANEIIVPKKILNSQFVDSGHFYAFMLCKIKKKQALLRSLLFCGERGIRTPGTSRYVGFQDRCNRPLCHLSNKLLCQTLWSLFLFDVAKVWNFFETTKCFGKKNAKKLKIIEKHLKKTVFWLKQLLYSACGRCFTHYLYSIPFTLSPMFILHFSNSSLQPLRM